MAAPMTLEDLKAKLNHLNGWQRAWLFICGILLVPHLLALYLFFPDSDYLIYTAPADTNRIIIREDKWAENFKEVCSEAATKEFNNSSTQSSKEVLSECREHAITAARARSDLDQEVQSKSTYRSQAFKVVFYTFLVYGLIVGSIYLIGYGLAWVKRGFTSK